MKKIIKALFATILSLSLLAIALTKVSIQAVGEITAELFQQESEDSIRYVSKVTNITDLSLIDHIDVKLERIHDGKVATFTDTLTEVYESVTGAFDAQENSYYAVYTLTDIDDSFDEQIINCTFDYVMWDNTYKSTNTVSYRMDSTYDYVYFLNTENWGNVYAHIWKEYPTVNWDTWPGNMLTECGDVNGIKMYRILVNKNNFQKIIFNNGEGIQTENLAYHPNYVYDIDGPFTEHITHQFVSTKDIHGELDNRSVDCTGCNYHLYSMNYLNPNSEYRTIYFQNTNDWENVYIHLWNEDITTTTWPGYKMTKEREQDYGHDLYSIRIPNGVFTKVIFNNNAGSQTVDLDLDLTGNWYFITGTDAMGQAICSKTIQHRHDYEEVITKVTGGLKYTDTCLICGNSYESVVSDTTTITCDHDYRDQYYSVDGGFLVRNSCFICGDVKTETITPLETDEVFYINERNWDTVCCHAWQGGSTTTKWPGFRMINTNELTTDGYEIWKASIPKGVFDTIIFNDNDYPGNELLKEQTASIPYSGSGVYHYDGTYESTYTHSHMLYRKKISEGVFCKRCLFCDYQENLPVATAWYQIKFTNSVGLDEVYAFVYDPVYESFSAIEMELTKEQDDGHPVYSVYVSDVMTDLQFGDFSENPTIFASSTIASDAWYYVVDGKAVKK